MTIEDRINLRRSIEVGILVIAILLAVGIIADGVGGHSAPSYDRRAASGGVTATVTAAFCATREQELATNE